MKSAPRRRLALAALIALCTSALAVDQCAQPAATSPPPPAASLHVVPVATSPLAGGAYYALVAIQVTAAAPLQAYDLQLGWSPGRTGLSVIWANASFSENTAIFASITHTSPPDFAAGRMAHAIDVRHGANSALGGSLGLFHLVLRVDTPGPIWVQASGKLARPDGTLFSTAPSARVRVMPPPS